MLVDNHNRIVNYLRLAVTDRCNLRCFYCMPEEGINFVEKEALLSYEELLRIINLLSGLGVSKVRITGGEPFVRKNLMGFLTELVKIPGITNVPVTTNGTVTRKFLPELIKLGITNFNLSLDTLNKERFFEITRRDYFDEVYACMEEMIDQKLTVKLNAVVMKDKNIEDILPMILLTKEKNISVRFIEEMPFNGDAAHYKQLEWNHLKILDHISNEFSAIDKIPDPKFSTAFNYQVKGFKGSFGIIPAYTRSFCGSCNRLRMTPQGLIKTCLYDKGVFNLRDLLRSGASDAEMNTAILEAVGNRAKDGFEAEKLSRIGGNSFESMASIGG